MGLEELWAEIAPIGRASASGGYFRQPFTSAELELRDWFRQAARARGFKVETDWIGNMVAVWRVPLIGYTRQEPEKGVMVGSHLDSVYDGGAYDGPLGVVSAFAAVDLLRERGFAPKRPVLIGAFTEEEGSRFGRACLGSRVAMGAMAWEEALALRDPDGVFLGDAVEAAGIGDGSSLDLRERVSSFVELHIEQGRLLADLDHPVGVGTRIWPHGRYRFDFVGVANHAGTTPMEDRADPMLTYAMTVLAANKQARKAGLRATFGRVRTTPNATNAVPSAVTAWLDARGDSGQAVSELVQDIGRQARMRAERDGTRVEVTVESESGEIEFDKDLSQWIAFEHEGRDWPLLPTAAGHDAGIVAAAGLPTAMLFVRNPTGVSHSPAEHADMDDCVAGVRALAETITRLAS
ncbi:MAG: allantoate amidohydrolase [Nocardioides sp.]